VSDCSRSRADLGFFGDLPRGSPMSLRSDSQRNIWLNPPVGDLAQFLEIQLLRRRRIS
jgi:hypothetical protein